MKSLRVNLVYILLSIIGATLCMRLVFLQIVNHGYYKALSQGQQNAAALSQKERGNILVKDRLGNSYVVASDQEFPLVFASPVEVKDRAQTAKKLSHILELDANLLLEEISNEGTYKILKKNISKEKQHEVEEQQLPGIYIAKEIARFYPQGTFAAHIIGFVNQDRIGQYGVEGHYNKSLEGKEQDTKTNPASYLRAAFNDTIQKNKDLHLTIDYNVQSLAESLLQKASETLRIEGGTVIVLHPQSGEIISLANTPVFDPNAYSKVKDLRVFQNPAIQQTYEPGSIFKPITMAAAIDEGKINPQTIYEDFGVVKIGGRTITNYDHRVWGERTMTEVLEFSINTGAIFAEQQLGHKKFLEYIEKFGLFEATNIDLAGEIFSENKEIRRGYEANFATSSFGQGIEMTPLQIVKAYSALANDGILINPHVLQDHIDKNEGERIISSQTAHALTTMLASVVENGFGKAARIPGYYIAGKTGTAQVAWSSLGIQKAGYSDKTIQSFIGYAPAFDPKFLILVKLDNPGTKTAEYSALPIFLELAKYLITYYQIPPDYEVE